MIQMFKSLWAMLTVWISVGEDFAHAAKEVSTYTREGAHSFRMEAQLEREQAYKDLQKRLKEAGIESKQ